ncbi:MAG TPA: hypothetical protein EYG38_11170 [Verrucomicrobia bacterium]|nr:hypothetical protein [Verrucomicrobiota bacterium]
MSRIKPEIIAKWVIGHRIFVILISLVGLMLMGFGASKIQLKNNYREFFSAENPQLKSLDALQNTYTKDDNIVMVLSHPDREVFETGYVKAIAWLTEEAWKLPFTTRVDSITNFQHSEAEGDDLYVDDLVPDPDASTKASLQKAKNVALNEPMIVNRLIGSNPRVSSVNVTVLLPDKSSMEAVQAANAARALSDRFKEHHPEFEVYLTGMVMLNNAFAESSIKDMKTLIPVMYSGILLVMAYLLRSVASTFVVILVVFSSSVSAMGLMGWVGVALTPPVATAPTIIMTLAIADSIHILVTLFHLMGQGQSKQDALVESLRLNAQPVFLTSLTTAIGFLSLNFSDAPPFRHLGNVVAAGVVLAWVFSVFTLPALISILPIREKRGPESDSRFLAGIADWVIAHRRSSLWGSSLCIVFLTVFIPTIELNDQWVDYFDERISFRGDTDFAMENLTGIYSIEYSIDSGEAGGINNPQYLKHLEEFNQWFKSQPGVLQVNSLADIQKRLNRNMHGDDSTYYTLPDRRDLAAQYLLLFEMSLPYGLDLNNQINVDKSASRFTATLANLSTRELRGTIRNAAEWQKANFPEALRAEGASPSVMFAYISERNINSMLVGTVIAILVISVVIGIFLKSAKFGIISLIPNIVPALMGFGIWALLVGSVGMSLSMVVGMTLGIVVDDTVNFISKYLRARREQGLNAAGAVRYAFHSVGKALVVTTVILSVGFAILSFSAFRLNGWMGQLTAIVILCAITADFILLPALLLTFDRGAIETSLSVEAESGQEATEEESTNVAAS